jgi:hypothetical protein
LLGERDAHPEAGRRPDGQLAAPEHRLAATWHGREKHWLKVDAQQERRGNASGRVGSVTHVK